jgi:flagellar hook-associated protein 2
MATSPLTFTGVSRFSDDLQAILQRAVRIASLPIQRMQLDQSNILGRKTALGSLNSLVTALTESFASLGLLGARGAVAASSSDPDVAAVQLTGSPETLSYSLSVTSAATAAQASTALGLADADTTAPRADGLYKLTVGSQVEDFDLQATGSGRTAGLTGSATPSPPVSVTVTFGNGLSGSITASLASFFVGATEVSGASAGDTVTVNFLSEDGSINTGITTDALAGGEDAVALAAALNAKIALNAELNGKVSFTSAGGKLKLTESDSVGQGFTFTSSATGTITTGLEAGGTIGGHSAAEIAGALNDQVALNSTLTAAGVTFTAVSGQVKLTANGGQKFTAIALDAAQGTGFVSGLAGKTRVVGYGNTLNGLRDYINLRESVVGVHATVVNTSSDPDNPRYDLSLAATATGAKTLTLLDSASADLLPAADTLGTNAVFSLNGGAAVTNTSNTITDLVTGLNLTIIGPGSATISVTKDRAAVRDSLEDFVARYNAVLAEVNQHIGEDAGLLTGSLVVRQIHGALRAITGYGVSTGTVRSMAALGLELSDTGELSLNAAVFNALTGAGFSDAVTFIGSTTTGFAGNAYSLLTQLTDRTTGIIQTAQDFFDVSDERLSKAIADAQERVRLLTASLQAQLTHSDSLLARLESQQGLLFSLFEEQRVIARSRL